jgi:hypothetical protein
VSGPGPGGGRLGRRQPECRLNRQQARQHARCSGLGGSQARSRLLSRRRWLVSKIEGLHRGSAGRRLLDGQGWAGNRRDRQESREPDRQPASQPFASMRQRSRRHARPLPGAAERVVAKVRSIEGWSPPQMPSRRMNRSAHRGPWSKWQKSSAPAAAPDAFLTLRATKGYDVPSTEEQFPCPADLDFTAGRRNPAISSAGFQKNHTSFILHK